MNEAVESLTAVILAGGLGTRLRDVLPDTPKPMAPVDGRPFLEYLVEQLRRGGFVDVVICVGYKADVIASHFGDGRGHGVHIRYAREETLLGTAGALGKARHLIASDPFLAMNGDSYCAADLRQLITEHRASGAAATIVATEVPDASRYGSLALAADGAVTGFLEKSKTPGPGLINAGIYLLNRAVLDLVPDGRPCSMERQVLPALVGRGLHAFKVSGAFIDIGIPAEFARAAAVLPS